MTTIRISSEALHALRVRKVQFDDKLLEPDLTRETIHNVVSKIVAQTKAI